MSYLMLCKVEILYQLCGGAIGAFSLTVESVETVELGRELVEDKALGTLVIFTSIGEKKKEMRILETVSHNEIKF